MQINEHRPLVLLVRERLLNRAHLHKYLAPTEMGAIVMPPVPAFYLNPVLIDDVAAQIAARAFNLLRIGNPAASA